MCLKRRKRGPFLKTLPKESKEQNHFFKHHRYPEQPGHQAEGGG